MQKLDFDDFKAHVSKKFDAVSEFGQMPTEPFTGIENLEKMV